MGDLDEFATLLSENLAKDKKRGQPISDLTREIARREEIANDQRVHLFRIIVGIVCASIVAVGVFVAFLGLNKIKMDTPVAIAFISAMAVQSFVLIGLLVRGLFMAPRHSAAQTVE